jgi:hypothetical protein
MCTWSLFFLERIDIMRGLRKGKAEHYERRF